MCFCSARNGKLLKYLNQNKGIYLVDISFDDTNKNIAGFTWEKAVN